MDDASKSPRASPPRLVDDDKSTTTPTTASWPKNSMKWLAIWVELFVFTNSRANVFHFPFPCFSMPAKNSLQHPYGKLISQLPW
ncbi:hypothetical protein GUJ93_ZPchr0006g44753 [Zizania palustris]|uniref:Uncharacterized protein n=1 Tax=Zizania palustris TaxID=103762 RepID=A0A8J5SZR2_ZIZPA|nr:hypothetical protein GUJ93_ZPchr0006g44753 [Zizania palustris]